MGLKYINMYKMAYDDEKNATWKVLKKEMLNKKINI